MPPKKDVKLSKGEIKKKEKVVEDKTFGLKNKKGAKTQKFIQHVQKNQLGNLQAQKQSSGPSKKEEKKKAAEELNMIFKPVQKIEPGVNPKSVLCAFFKQGTCTKGDKCKFSHDLNTARKAATKNYYEESTTTKKNTNEKEETMQDWDDDKLKEIVEKKHGDNDRKMPKTDIICKHFLEALENSKYGWFWECPSGGERCHYRHVLPVGFVLKKDMKKEKKEELSIEDLVERERAALGYDLPKITLSSFMAWKTSKIAEKRNKAVQESEKRKADFKAGKSVTGRDIFTFNPDLVKDEDMDDGETAFDTKTREDQDDDVKALELDLDKLAAGALDVNASSSGTVVDSKERKFNISGAINEDLFDDLEDLEEEDTMTSGVAGITLDDQSSS